MSKTTSQIKSTLHVLFNEEVVLEFDRNKTIPEKQREYLDNMDERMDDGIQLSKDFIAPPNLLQKAQFVANSMVNGLLKQDFNQAIAMCTYLGNRLPELKQIVCIGQEDETGIKIEFVYDRDFQQSQQEQTIQFFNPKDFMKH